MAETRARHEWNQTAHVLAMLWNANRAPGAAAKRPADFNPCEPAGPREPDVTLGPKESMTALRAVFGRK